MTESNAETLSGFGRTQSALMKMLLRNKEGLTVDQIAQELGVTRTAVNQHLAALERDGYIQRRDVVPTGGRPSRVYALSERGIHLFPKNYDAFSLMTLEALIDSLGADQVKKVLEQLGRNLGKDLAPGLVNKPLDQRIHAIITTLQELGFDAHLEKLASSNAAPIITAYNCIYHALAQMRPEVCELDLAFLRKASGAEVEHVDCMAKGANQCRFKFSEQKGAHRPPN
ncbi:MAG: HTH domain-containing protein [Alphaproteobacteria bacterium]|nr:HTH domain-containing protein [Alphaproteobacteria bacterium]